MIAQILILLLAIVPGLLICWYIYKLDKYEKEPTWPLIIAFFIGVLLTLPAFKIEAWASQSGWDETAYVGTALLASFIVVALTEEALKYLALRIYPTQQSFFNEPMDGIVYAVMLGMGFATVENIIYAVRYGIETTVLRNLTAVPAHAAFAIIMGYFIGLAKFSKEGRQLKWSLGLLIPFLLHGTYDFFILQEIYDGLMILALFTLGYSLYLSRRLVLLHQENSPFHD
ncbi:MAG TPA: PrsW family glutamic-type intramembrane protease [Saprospiraceae bacterium]|mgnify:CR=1 FL=1|nr:PrsW family glutamic-type intramembrane protease [Saprospiraceae bacterium]HMQ83429.1 PrsW family glutamic-type intramembrane protease [Saprospiraceae bacterium]